VQKSLFAVGQADSVAHGVQEMAVQQLLAGHTGFGQVRVIG
jgi:hypothetical protein